MRTIRYYMQCTDLKLVVFYPVYYGITGRALPIGGAHGWTRTGAYPAHHYGGGGARVRGALTYFALVPL